jgi:hypothetical protein
MFMLAYTYRWLSAFVRGKDVRELRRDLAEALALFRRGGPA